MILYLVVELIYGSSFNVIKLFTDETEAIEFVEGEHNASLEIYEIEGTPVNYNYSRE